MVSMGPRALPVLQATLRRNPGLLVLLEALARRGHLQTSQVRLDRHRPSQVLRERRRLSQVPRGRLDRPRQSLARLAPPELLPQLLVRPGPPELLPPLLVRPGLQAPLPRSLVQLGLLEPLPRSLVQLGPLELEGPLDLVKMVSTGPRALRVEFPTCCRTSGATGCTSAR